MTRVLIADDHAIVRAGTRQFLAANPSIRGIGEAASGQETLHQLSLATWDVLILDIQLPDGNGLKILSQVRMAHPRVRVLMMSGLPEAQYARLALRAGASGYVPQKGGRPDQLLTAVQAVASGRRYVSDALAESLAFDVGTLRDGAEAAHEILSARDLEVFRRIAHGTPITAIAQALGLSIKTVSTYRARVMEKMQLQSNADITTYALRHGLRHQAL